MFVARPVQDVMGGIHLAWSAVDILLVILVRTLTLIAVPRERVSKINNATDPDHVTAVVCGRN
jgi:hypothetical protein